jgi:hypothetical protein
VIAKAAAALTLMAAIPVMELLVVSVAVMVSAPAVSKVTGKFPVPIVNVESAGSFACASELVKCTVPAYPVDVLFAASSAVTVTETVRLVSEEGGPVTERCVAALVTTLIAPEVPFSEAVIVSEAVMVWGPMVTRVTGKVCVPFIRGELMGSAAWVSLLVNFKVPV